MSKVDTENNVDASTESIGFFRLCCGRLCSNKFTNESFRSKSAYMSEKDLSKMDEKSHLRGRWNNRVEFLLSCIGFAVGLGNVWRFPIRVYESGGGAFLIPYLILCLILGVPLLLMEMGLGQFSGLGPTNAFKCVPLFFGVGWSMVLVSFMIDWYYGVIISWSYFYFFGSFDPNLPWSKCNHYFNTPKCLDSYTDKSKLNASIGYISSTQEYWDYYVTGFTKLNGKVISMNENPGAPQWHLSLCLLLTWVVAAISLMFGVKVSGKIIYFSVIFPYVVIICLIILGCTLPGAGEGIKYYLYPDFNVMIKPKTLLSAVEQLFFSTSIAMGGMITFSSFNDFRDNIYRDVIIVVLADFVTSFIAGFAVFPILGYMAHRSGVPVKSVVRGGAGLFFVTYPEALATLPGSNFWTLIFMLMAITLGMDSQFAMFECISTALGDTFPILRKNKWYKVCTVCTLSLVFFLLGLLLVTPGGMYWFDVLDTRVSSYALPFIAFCESLTIGCFYGLKHFRLNYRMMLGFSLNWYWLIMMGIVSPVIILAIIIASIVQYSPIIIAGQPIPGWGEAVGVILLLVVILWIPIGMIWTIIKFQKRNPAMSSFERFKLTLKPPTWWGPYYKLNWLLSTQYRQKLIENKDDPSFLRHVVEVEDLNAILKMASKEQ